MTMIIALSILAILFSAQATLAAGVKSQQLGAHNPLTARAGERSTTFAEGIAKRKIDLDHAQQQNVKKPVDVRRSKMSNRLHTQSAEETKRQLRMMEAPAFPFAKDGTKLAADAVVAVVNGPGPKRDDDKYSYSFSFSGSFIAEPSQKPTRMPSHIPTVGPGEPTLTPTPMPSRIPTVGPGEPTFTPSISPTFSPTFVAPTAAPTAVPTIAPSFVPTAAPTTYRPTTPGETNRPTPSPTRKPTSRPSFKPTRSPTQPPGELLQFATNATLSGFPEPAVNETDVFIVQNTTAVSMGTSYENLEPTNTVVTEVTTRRLTTTADGRSVEVLATSYTIDYEYEVVVSVSTTDADDATALYDELTTNLNASVADGSYLSTLQANAEEQGEETIFSSVAVVSVTVGLPDVTVVGEDDDGGDGDDKSSSNSKKKNNDDDSDEGLSDGAIAGIVIGVLVGVALLCGLVYYFFFMDKKSGGLMEGVEESSMESGNRY